MDAVVRKWLTYVEDTRSRAESASARTLRKVTIAAVIPNPYAGRWSEALDELVGPSASLAAELAERAVVALAGEPESCGKAALVGVAGEQEHGVACLTTPFGDALRDAIGGSTWVTSTTKVGPAGATIDVPLAYKRALFVRSHYDTVTMSVPDAPRPDEIVVIVALANGPRVDDRCGGLTVSAATAGDGLR
jgi:hypothetical protein